MEIIPQSVAKRVPLKAYLSSDHISPATGKTIAVVISKNAAAFGNPSGGSTNATEIANGWYYVDLSTTDTGTAGPLIVRGTVSGVDDVEIAYTVANAHNAGFDGVPNAAAEASGGLYTRGTGAGQINQANNGQTDANAVRLGGTTLTGRDIGASVLLSSGTGTGQLDFTTGAVKIQAPAKKNTAISAFEFLMVDNTGTPTTGLTVTGSRSIDGGTYGACSNSPTEVGGGAYKIDLSAADLNGNVIGLRFSAAGASDSNLFILTLP